jgi:hypothetical protein
MRLAGLVTAVTTGQILYVPSHHFYRWRRSRDIELTAPMRSAPRGTPGVLEVHMLTGRRHYVDLLYAAKSFVQFYRDPVSIVIHADTSLTAGFVHRIRHHLPCATVFSRAQRDEMVEPRLRERGLPNCSLFRRLNPFAAKLIDAPILSSSDRICLLDSDCVAFRALDHLSHAIQNDRAKWIFARDPQRSPYCLSEQQAERHFGFPLEHHLNTGFCVVDPRELDLSVIERWLEPGAYPLHSHFAEQTVIAALATRGGVTFLPESEVNIGRTRTEAECSLIHYCGHYLSHTRIAMRREGQPLLLRSLKQQAT